MKYCRLRQAGEKLQQLKKQDTDLASEAAQTIADYIYHFVNSKPYRCFGFFAGLAFHIDESERLDAFPIEIEEGQKNIDGVKYLLSEELLPCKV